MRLRVRVLAQAEADATAAAEWYESRSPGLGARFLAAVVATLERVADGPAQYMRFSRALKHRRANVQRFPYAVVFSVEGDEIEVVAVAHGRRRPGYWVR
ncbi:MAG: type II toxin-antitoxin system RelE/ParE family toxin [Myxococcales bacterium]|nr:type II toxin-antitoxin system RelE/ParE family toxin [Myxococcales bacterium]